MINYILLGIFVLNTNQTLKIIDNLPDGELVTSIKHWTNRLFSFRIERPISLRFRSGAFVMIGLPGENGKPLYRAYSIASPSWGEELEFYSINIKVQRVITTYELTLGIYLNLLAQLHYAFESLIQKQDGFISVVVNTNDAQTRIANYTQWENQDKFLVILRSTQSNFNVF